MKHCQDLGERQHHRINLQTPAFVIPAPDAVWINCFVVDISRGGVCLDVGALPVPKTFGLAFDATGCVLRVCQIVWRRGELIGARFLSAKELRQGVPPCDAKPDRRDPGSPGARPGLPSRL
jgi:PilZ domain